jgi:hypothetical protein
MFIYPSRTTRLRGFGNAMGALAMALSFCATAPVVAADRPGGVLSAATQIADANEPSLPPAPPPVGPLRRGKDGSIEVIDPTKERGTGRRLCSAGAICVGPGQAYKNLSDALTQSRKGDTIEVIGGTYHETVRIAQDTITVRGVAGRPVFSCAGMTPADDKACFLLAGHDITLENLEISGAEVSAAMGANAACIRNEHGMDFTVREVICHGSQEGILSDGGSILIENSEFFDNGWTDRTHNVYLSGDCITATIRGSIFRDARIGHEFKSRCQKTLISDSTFRSTKGSRDIDIPDGGETTIYRSTLVKTAGTQNPELVGFAAESCRFPAALTLDQVHIVNSAPNAAIHNFDLCVGQPIVMKGVTIEGPEPRLTGYIIRQ